ncbi:hypothetical protein RAMDARK_1182 [Rickettsia amblyommatis str. Darkwater]|uniref:Uncharacterized protein n=1 Tax=Rickettsia amblyommatis str. Ac/Pa TaxID=1359164 RepID=A0A0F3N362_RICAM|nr:hypothetical protein APHACPA_1553 [Rickettsia amblyommatis str. Ac/Pa]KJV91084.1 hypothetical protein RAMDARK_1182 [Rickettsia amblyommatis str. Darkwater]
MLVQLLSVHTTLIFSPEIDELNSFSSLLGGYFNNRLGNLMK